MVLKPGAVLRLAELRNWARARLSEPKLPRRMLTLDALPRNAMGKVAKIQRIHLFEA